MCEHEQQNRVQTAVVPQRGVRKDDLKMSERYSTVVRSTAKNERGGVLPLPKIVMVKRKSDSYELLPDHRLFMIISIVCAITGVLALLWTHTSSAHIIYMSPGYNA